jgi:hypothetical protein
MSFQSGGEPPAKSRFPLLIWRTICCYVAVGFGEELGLLGFRRETGFGHRKWLN